MRAADLRRSVRGLLVMGSVLLITAPPVPAYAAVPPEPVSTISMPDPAVAKTSDGFVAVSSAPRVKRATSQDASGPWTVTDENPLPTDFPDWVKPGEPGAWAPELHQVGDMWVLYFAVLAKGMDDNQRCIGAATAEAPTDKFTFVERPLVCPENAAGDNVPGRPLRNAGVIDPSFFQASNGFRYLVYKTQLLPASLRIVRLDSTGTKVREGAESRELVQSDNTIIEHPLLVERPNNYFLFASYRTYNTCNYQTIYMKAPTIDKGAFQSATKHELLTSGNTDLCGPGGADIADAEIGMRIFFHGWVCDGTKPCPATYNNDTSDHGTRVMYARIFSWDGSTPTLGRWVTPSP